MAFKMPEYVTGHCPPNMGFPQSRADKVIAKHDGAHEIRHNELRAQILARHAAEWSDVVVLEHEPNRSGIFGCRVYHDWLDRDATDYTPLSLFQWFISRFGLDFKIGTFEGKLLLAEQVDLAGASALGTQLVQLKNPKNHSCIQSMHIRISPDGTHVDAALAFCIDTTAYGQAIAAT